VVKYLENRGFKILDRNYLRKWGELDIVAEKDKIVHFIEVKSVSCENNLKNMAINRQNVSRETSNGYRAEDNMHSFKTKRLRRIIETYIEAHDFMEDMDFQCDLAVVKIYMSDRIARVSLIENIVFSI
jgi:Holliday junction resolvase-like predicted endonuclease